MRIYFPHGGKHEQKKRENRHHIRGGGLGRAILPDVRAKYPDAHLLYTDGNPAVWGTDISGIGVVSPEAALVAPDAGFVVVIASLQGYRSIRAKLKETFKIADSAIDDSFSKTLHKQTFAVRDEFVRAFSRIVSERKLGGSCAEGGVFEGDFAAVINSAFPDRKLYLFDTFSGFDQKDLKNESEFTKTRKNGFRSEMTAQHILSRMAAPEHIEIKKGYFPETAHGIEDEFIFVNLDFDLYAPTLEGLKFFYPKLKKGGVILVHDYFAMDVAKEFSFSKVKNAVDEFCAANDLPFYPIGDKLSVAITK